MAGPEKSFISGKNWYQVSAAEALERLGSDLAQGLSNAEAQRRLAEHGPNELVERGGRTRTQILIEQFTNILTLILAGAAIVSIALGEEVEAVVILAIVILNGVLGYVQEYKAEQSMAALKRMSVPKVRLRREGKMLEVSATEVVPGDVIVLETGNVVPADGRVLLSNNLRVMEAALTGESEAVEKSAELVFETEKPLGDRRNMLYSGTVVSYGRGEMLVTATGMGTELGKIADMLQAVTQEKTPLQERLDKLGRVLAVVALAIIGVIFFLGVRQAQSREDVIEVLLTAVSLAVAAIPEAMTAVVTIALSLGAQRMLKRQALIRKLPAVETLGSVSVICSDKTGTLTQNRMTVTALDIANHRFDLVQRLDDQRFALAPAVDLAKAPGLQPTLDLLLVGGALCNDSILVNEERGGEGFHAFGDPTEGALVLAAAEYGILKQDLDAALPRVAELPFDSVRKRMTTVHRIPRSSADIPASLVPVFERQISQSTPPFIAFTKGAIDGLMPLARQVWVEGVLQPFDEAWQQRVQSAHDDLARNGMRVLGVALRPLEQAPTPWEVKDLEQELVLIGLYGMMDPPRPEVKDAVAVCKSAGIRPVMITGDHPLTARHIAQQLGITGTDQFLTGQELDKLSDPELRERAGQVSVFARVSPEHKLRLIQVYRDQGHIVAMTGDGVNDAPALKKADIGVAMGITGTDVSKEASDMVLLDDNFATIVAAVEEGRIIFDNIRKFIKYLLSCNASEIAVMLLGPLLGMPLPLLPLQILWMNLVTDGLPALALGVEPAEVNVMKRKPYSSQESIFGRGMAAFILVLGIVMSLVALYVGAYSYRTGDPAWQTLLFTTLIFAQLALALGVRSEETSIFRMGPFTNRSMVLAVLLTVALQLAVVYLPFLQALFGTTALPPRDFGIAILAGLTIILAVEAWKWVHRRTAKKPSEYEVLA